MASANTKSVTTCVNLKTGTARILIKGACEKTEKKVIRSSASATPSATTSAIVDPNATCAQGGTCAIGDIGPGNGIIFYVASSLQLWGQYMEASSTGWRGGGEDPSVDWCPAPVSLSFTVKIVKGKPVPSGSSKAMPRALTKAAATAIGTGRANTAAIELGGTDIIGKLMLAYHGGGKSDWFLRSLYELNEMYNQRVIIGGLTINSIGPRQRVASIMLGIRLLTLPLHTLAVSIPH